MERESFEDEEVARALNQHFVSIKVDREERPDIDHIYMTFCQMLTGHGGWPLTIFMTPEQKPFYAGTYFPKKGRRGMPGLLEILDRVQKAWEQDKEGLLESGEQVAAQLQPQLDLKGEPEQVTRDVLDKAYRSLQKSFEPAYGGFSKAPKFPTPHNLSFLLRYWKATGSEEALKMVEKTLDGMYRGGIFDHIGFGFSRYSTDQKWLVPHFEKMLYDNALLATAYLEAYQATGREAYGETARKIFTYVLRDMTSPEGGFYSAEDADSEGVEGKFYVWDLNEVQEVLGEKEGKHFCEYYGITAGGNFEGKSIPNRISASGPANENEDLIRPLREKIFEAREKRVHPYKDDKILTSWNGLMIAALALGGRVLEDSSYIDAAEDAVEFVLHSLTRESDGRLMARYREGETAHLAYLDDYAFFIWGLIELYQTTYKPIYLHRAIRLNEDMIKYFWDEEAGGFYLYGKDGEKLIGKPKEVYDGALPSGNSVAAVNLFKLARLTGSQRLEEMAARQVEAFGGVIGQNPAAYTHFMMAVMFSFYPTQEVVISGDAAQQDTGEMIRILHSDFHPQVVSLLHSEGQEGKKLEAIVPFVRGQGTADGRAAAYVCENFTCHAPITDPDQFRRSLL